MGEKIIVNASRSDTVAYVKEQIFALEGVAVDKQHLLFSGKKLNNTQTLAGCGIVQNSIITLEGPCSFFDSDSSDSGFSD